MSEEPLLFWFRVGEAGEYASASSIEFAMVALQNSRFGKFTNWKRFGFETNKLRGVDYVSLYWGDSAGDPVRYLTPEEKKQIEEILK